MGIINVTPDSFSDGGDRFDPGLAVAEGERLAAEGADILDIGGESTRPGAQPIDPQEECDRVVPVIAALAKRGYCLSVDTRHALVMERALDAGARIVNDITALTGEAESLPLVAARRAPVVLMHMQGDPRTMQQAPHYEDVVGEVAAYLAERLAACRAAGLPDEALCVDPGIGFGKTLQHNLTLLAQAGRFAALGVAVLIGVSRKSFIGRLSAGEAPKDRFPGSLAAGLAALARGGHILRVHDVAETAQALKVWQAIEAAGPSAV